MQSIHQMNRSVKLLLVIVASAVGASIASKLAHGYLDPRGILAAVVISGLVTGVVIWRLDAVT